jgi:hypothetical protein
MVLVESDEELIKMVTGCLKKGWLKGSMFGLLGCSF